MVEVTQIMSGLEATAFERLKNIYSISADADLVRSGGACEKGEEEGRRAEEKGRSRERRRRRGGEGRIGTRSEL